MTKPEINIELEEWQRASMSTAIEGEYYAWAGIELRSLRPGHAAVSFTPRPIVVTPWGTVNGGVINSLLEVPSFLALLTDMKEHEFAVTNDIFVQNLRPITAGVEVILEGRLLQRSRRMAWCESSACIDGKPHSVARITKTLLER
ncbi:PaaI family thioesterase [Myxococcota bacterium]|nr:PaaI family thioesterase [Myxococcota bacterium]